MTRWRALGALGLALAAAAGFYATLSGSSTGSIGPGRYRDGRGRWGREGPSTVAATPYVYVRTEFAPPTGLGMTAPCDGLTPTSVDGGLITFTRPSVAECPSNDGQTYTQVASGQPRVSSGAVDSTLLGLWEEMARTNSLNQSRNLTGDAWTKSNVTCTQTATGMRGAANSASHCVATANNGTVLQPLTLGSSAFAFSAHFKNHVGDGGIQLTVNGGSTVYDVGGHISPTQWRRAVPAEVAGCTALVGSACIVQSGLSVTAANPSPGFRIDKSGDSVDVDFAQLEVSSLGNATTPIETFDAGGTRAAEMADLAMSPAIDAGFCMAATYVGQLTNLIRPHGVPGDRLPGVATGSTSYADSFYGPWTVETTATSPVSSATGQLSTSPVNRFTSYYNGATLNGCLNGVCGAGTAATFTPPVGWLRYRLNGYDASNGALNGVMKEVEFDQDSTRCRPLYRWSLTQVAAIGDSITSGGTGGATGWPESLQVLYGGAPRIGNYGISGATVSTMLTNQFEAKVRGRFNKVVVLGGINNIRAGTSATTIFAGLKTIYDEAADSGMAVVPITLTPTTTAMTGAMQTELLALNVSIRGAGYPYVDAYNSLLRVQDGGIALEPLYDSGDGLHPNQAGEDYLATLVHAVIP